MRTPPVEPTVEDLRFTAVMQALSDPVRVSIVSQLVSRGEVACGAFDLDIPKSSLSHHFRVLRESGLISTRLEGKLWLNTLRKGDIEERFPGLLEAVIQAIRADSVAPRDG